MYVNWILFGETHTKKPVIAKTFKLVEKHSENAGLCQIFFTTSWVTSKIESLLVPLRKFTENVIKSVYNF